jgi:transposase
MEVKARLTLEQLKRLERSGQSKRLRVVILAMEGWTAPAVAMAAGLSRRVCQDWVYRFNEQGLAGLEDQRGRQPTSPLTPEQKQQIRQRIDAGPTAADGVCSLRGVDVKRFLQQEFGLALPEEPLLEQSGLRRLRRPRTSRRPSLAKGRPRSRTHENRLRRSLRRNLPQSR